jgi:O-antigen/teichoic acid export membrane protein
LIFKPKTYLTYQNQQHFSINRGVSQAKLLFIIVPACAGMTILIIIVFGESSHLMQVLCIVYEIPALAAGLRPEIVE